MSVAAAAATQLSVVRRKFGTGGIYSIRKGADHNKNIASFSGQNPGRQQVRSFAKFASAQLVTDPQYPTYMRLVMTYFDKGAKREAVQRFLPLKAEVIFKDGNVFMANCD